MPMYTTKHVSAIPDKTWNLSITKDTGKNNRFFVCHSEARSRIGNVCGEGGGKRRKFDFFPCVLVAKYIAVNSNDSFLYIYIYINLKFTKILFVVLLSLPAMLLFHSCLYSSIYNALNCFVNSAIKCKIRTFYLFVFIFSKNKLIEFG